MIVVALCKIWERQFVGKKKIEIDTFVLLRFTKTYSKKIGSPNCICSYPECVPRLYPEYNN